MILHTSRFVTVFATGLLAGILFGDRMGASFARPTLPAASFVQFQQVQHLRFVPMMPILMGLAIVASVAWLVSVRSQFRSIGFGLLALATIGVGAVMVLTRAVNVPINEELMTWSVSAPPADVIALWRPWEQAHTVRTTVAVLAFTLQLFALTLLPRTGSIWTTEEIGKVEAD